MKSLNLKFAFCALLLRACISWADVSHFFLPEFGFFQQQPPQSAFPFAPTAQLPSLYAPPPAQQQPQVPQGYPESLKPSPVPPSATPAPVAPVVTTTTEFTLPEVIENRRAKEHGVFIPLRSQYLPPAGEQPNYESPQPPNQGDVLRPPSNVYYYPRPTTTPRPDPIVVFEPPNQPTPIQGYDYNVPQRPSTPAPAYLPPTGDTTELLDNNIVEHLDHSSSLRLRVKEMRCLLHERGYFRAVLKVDSFIGATPSVDNDAQDKHCELRLSRSFVVVDIAAADFHTCGVHQCGKDLCLRVRFPIIRGMRTGSDAILTLHCKTQERVVVKAHALKMGVANDIQSRNLGTYAHGGGQSSLRTHVELLRQTGNGYTKPLESNNLVQLGEELLLRAHVLTGDGWNYTKLTDVSLQRISPSGELLNNVNLITPRGCLNPSMQSICPYPPAYDPPLGHKLAFKAVMFQGMRSGEDLVISLRITGCLEQHDCVVNANECLVNGVSRKRRDTMKNLDRSINDTEVSEISRIYFKVIMPVDKEATEDVTLSKDKQQQQQRRQLMSLGIALGFVSLLAIVGVFVNWKLRS